MTEIQSIRICERVVAGDHSVSSPTLCVDVPYNLLARRVDCDLNHRAPPRESIIWPPIAIYNR